MAEFQHTVRLGYLTQPPKQHDINDIGSAPYWARHVQHAQNLLECSDEPIVYDHDDQDNCFFFPEDCSWAPPKDFETETETTSEICAEYFDGEVDDEYEEYEDNDNDSMIPGLPDIKMLDAEALSDLLEDNLSPPEITSIMVFATNGAIFAHASSLSTRQLRNLSATYGAAYTCYAKTISSGNLTGVNPASHPSSYVTAQSFTLGDVGSIVFELGDLVAVVTRIADKVLLAAVGPSKLQQQQDTTITNNDDKTTTNEENNDSNVATDPEATTTNTETTSNTNSNTDNTDSLTLNLERQYQIDRSADLARLESLNLTASPAILLALESKSAALGKFLGQKLASLESPDDF